MSPRRTDAISRALETKGFQKQDSHHEMYWLHVDGKKTSVRTRISHGDKEYGDSLLGLMAKQVGLARRELDDSSTVHFQPNATVLCSSSGAE